MSRGDAVFAVTLVFFTLASVFVGMRMVSRLFIVKKIDWDDGLMGIAWGLAFALSFATMYAAQHGLGLRDANILPEWELPLKRAEYVFSISYNPVLMATKSSILILYLRMSQANPFFRWASVFLLGLVNTAGIVLAFLNIFQCSPVSAALHLVAPGEAKCINLVYLYLCSAPVNVITDLAIVLLPLPILTGIRMERKQKYVVVGTFCTGLFVAVVDVIRIAYLQTALYQQYRMMDENGTTRPTDFGYTASYSYMWSAVEVNTGLICASVLVLKPLMKKISPKAWGGPGPVRAARRGSKKASTSDPGAKMGLDLSAADRDGAVALGPRQRSSSYDEKSVPTMRFTEPDPILRRQGVMHNLQPIDEEALGTGDSDSIRPAPNLTRSISPFCVDPNRPATPTRKVDLGDMDFMDFLAISEAEMDGVGNRRPSGQSTEKDGYLLDEGVVTVRQPAAVCNELLGREQTRHPEPAPVPPRKRRMTILTLGSAVSGAGTQAPDTAFSDFVNLTSTKPLTELTRHEAFWPIMSVSILFFTWGFSYGLLGSLNAQIEDILNFSAGKSLAFYSAYWVGYLLGPTLMGYWVLSRGGAQPFKATFICGLWLFACGAMAFWPSSVIASFPGFFVSNMLLASGLACLEVAANLFVAIAGPDHLSEARLNFAQAIQGIASVISPVLAHKALFTNVRSRDSLVDTQWCYLAVGLAVIALSVVFYYLPLNEADNATLERLADDRQRYTGIAPDTKVLGLPIKWLVMGSGITAMSLYIGAQEATSYYWFNFVTEVYQSSVFSDAFNLRCIGQGIFAFSRFLAAGLCYLGVPPRILLAICTVGATACAALTISLPNGKAPIVMGIIVFLFEAPIFPTLFAITLRGMGRHTRLTSAGLVTALCGGGLWPSVAYAIRTEQDANARVTLAIVPVLYGACAVYALGLNLSPTIRNWLKPGLIGQDPSRQPSFSPSVFRHTSKGEHDVSASATSQS
ncbi:hypothetical protein FFLO_05281 [Filobasidium floriforme]|uniref:Rhodopsin domain-containing protein n=1 Tax=Filobasidium floriforme TaxID=5210 RepID=A0A8K0NNC8_9TREE|nr:hypothetical protein FFLO_05281 [Filobasidium floriforme]